MWLFGKERKRIRDAFARQVPPAVLDAIEKTPNANFGPDLRKRALSYAIFYLRDDGMPEGLSGRLSKAMTIALGEEGMIETIFSTLISVTFDEPSGDKAKSCSEKLLAALGADVKVLYGRGECWKGNIGSNLRMAYGTIFPHLDDLLNVLGQTPFGSSVRFDVRA